MSFKLCIFRMGSPLNLVVNLDLSLQQIVPSLFLISSAEESQLCILNVQVENGNEVNVLLSVSHILSSCSSSNERKCKHSDGTSHNLVINALIFSKLCYCSALYMGLLLKMI